MPPGTFAFGGHIGHPHTQEKSRGVSVGMNVAQSVATHTEGKGGLAKEYVTRIPGLVILRANFTFKTENQRRFSKTWPQQPDRVFERGL